MAHRLVWVSSLMFGLLVLGLAAQNGAVLALVLPLVIYLGAGLLYGPAPIRLEAARTLNVDYAAPGEPVVIHLSIVNRGSRLEEVLLEDLVSPPSPTKEWGLPRPTIEWGLPRERIEGESQLLTSLLPGETVEMQYTLSARRGYYRFQGVRVTASDRLNLFRRQVTLAAPGQFFVVPAILKLRRVAIRPSRTRAYAGFIPTRQGGPGVDFFGVRDYQTGDPLRWINWKATARTEQSIFTTEFEQERVADVGLILDVRRRSYRRPIGDPILEHAILATAALAEAFLSAGNRVGMLLYGRLLDWTFPGYGKVQRERVLRALARAELGESMVFDRLEYIPTRMFPAQSQLVMISPLLDGDAQPLISLRAHGYSLLVISPNPIPLEEKMWGRRPAVQLAARIARVERALLLRNLRQAGVRVLDWDVDTPFEQAVYTTLGRSPLWRHAIGLTS